jgi:FAD/FMN-containing dehydrogenase
VTTSARDSLPPLLATGLSAAGVGVRTDQAVLAGHCVDWTGRWTGPALGLVEPRSTQDVAVVLGLAKEHRIPVQVQGGNTGLVGGSVPDRPALLLLTTGLAALGPVDRLERTVVAGAGVTATTLAAHARAAGLHLGVDLASRDSATIGGMAATNAGGIGVAAFGMMRDQVRGLTAVLADGRVVRTVGRPRKDNTGYDLSGLLVGSEGTLGVITEVELVLHDAPTGSSLGVLGVPSLAEAVSLARRVQSAGARLLAAEVVDSAGVARAARALALPDPLAGRAGWLLLLEVADGATADGLTPVADRVLAVATEPGDRRRLWAYRERQTELYAALDAAGLEKLDVSLRLDRLDEAVAAIRRAVDGPTGVGMFGHALDGNLHLQLLGAGPGTFERVLAAVVDLGGSISAEHGIGRMKADLLPLARSADEISWMRQIKAAVDSDGLLNPGVLLVP